MVDNEGQFAFHAKCLSSYMVVFDGAEHELFNADRYTRDKYYRTLFAFYDIIARLPEEF